VEWLDNLLPREMAGRPLDDLYGTWSASCFQVSSVSASIQACASVQGVCDLGAKRVEITDGEFDRTVW